MAYTLDVVVETNEVCTPDHIPVSALSIDDDACFGTYNRSKNDKESRFIQHHVCNLGIQSEMYQSARFHRYRGTDPPQLPATRRGSRR